MAMNGQLPQTIYSSILRLFVQHVGESRILKTKQKRAKLVLPFYQLQLGDEYTKKELPKD